MFDDGKDPLEVYDYYSHTFRLKRAGKVLLLHVKREDKEHFYLTDDITNEHFKVTKVAFNNLLKNRKMTVLAGF